jgi:hypothetical protein
MGLCTVVWSRSSFASVLQPGMLAFGVCHDHLYCSCELKTGPVEIISCAHSGVILSYCAELWNAWISLSLFMLEFVHITLALLDVIWFVYCYGPSQILLAQYPYSSAWRTAWANSWVSEWRNSLGCLQISRCFSDHVLRDKRRTVSWRHEAIWIPSSLAASQR